MMLTPYLFRLMLFCLIGMSACLTGAATTGRVWAGPILSYYAPADNDPYYDIFVFDPRTRILQNLTRNTANDSVYAWSPDGSRMAFISTRIWGIPDLFVINATGHDLQQVKTGFLPAQPSWSPEGDAITFVGVTDEGQPDVLAVTPKTGEVTRLTQTRDEREKTALWSPDGRYIAYLTEENPFVYVVKPDGTERKLVTLVYSDMPSWSPDGKSIAFVAQQDDSLQLQAVDHAQQSVLFRGNKPITTPIWSPDGRYLAFDIAYTDQHALIVVQVATGEFRAVKGFWSIDSPAWSPDGQTLAFFGTPVDNPQNRGIWLYNPQTRERHLELKVARLNALAWRP